MLPLLEILRAIEVIKERFNTLPLLNQFLIDWHFLTFVKIVSIVKGCFALGLVEIIDSSKLAVAFNEDFIG